MPKTRVQALACEEFSIKQPILVQYLIMKKKNPCRVVTVVGYVHVLLDASVMKRFPGGLRDQHKDIRERDVSRRCRQSNGVFSILNTT